MKRFLFTMIAMSSLIWTSCEKTPQPNAGGEDYPVPESGKEYLLEGTVKSAGFTWESASSVGIYSSTEGVKATNLECKIVGWEMPETDQPEEGTTPEAKTKASEYAGQAIARFNTPALDLVKGENKFFVYTPYNKDLVYVRGMIYGLDISDSQEQPAPNVAGACFSCGTAKGIAGVDEAFKFELNPVTALAKISIASSEYAGYNVRKVTILDQNGEAKLGGGFNVNVEDMSFQVTASFSKVSTIVKSPEALEANKSQDFYLQILPGDFSSKDLYVVVELQKDNINVTLPIKKTGLVFEGGQVTEIKLDNLSEQDNSFAWYVPVEKRYLSGLKYAYGEANTFLIQCKNGSTYTGATYTPDPEIPDEVKIDIRPRGDFSKVVDPKGATFEWYMNGTNIYTPRTAGYEQSKIDPTKYTFSYDGEYTVTVKNEGAYAGTPILLMKKDNKVLWAWTFWNIAADGTKLEGIECCTGDLLANMDLGQATTQYETWTTNKKTGSTSPDPVFRMTHFYQQGRTMPTFWNNYWSLAWKENAGNVPAIAGPVTLAESIENPVGLILHPEDNANLGSWSKEPNVDLWGGNRNGDKTDKGEKSLHDPCPKGWRVAYPGLYEEIIKTPISYEELKGAPGIRYSGAANNLFITSGYGNGKTATNGRLATMGGAESATSATCKYGIYHSNMTGIEQSITLLFHSSVMKTNENRIGSFNKTVSAPVRCMKDTENR